MVECFLVENDFVSIDKVLFDLMRKYSLDRVDVVGSRYFLDHLGHFIVEMSRLNEAESGLCGLIGCENDVGLFTSDGCIFVGLDHEGVASNGDESIDVYSEFDLDEVSFLDVGGVLLHGGVVGTDFVDGNSCGEAESLEDCFFIIDFGEVFVDLSVGPEAELKDFAADCDLLDEFG